MKLGQIVLISLVMVGMFSTLTPILNASQRVVMCEDFTNASCPPCAAVNPSLRAMFNALTHDTCIALAYHVWWPGVDPMYNYNTTEVTPRVNYYAVEGVPHLRVDGSYGITPATSNISTIRNYIRSRYTAASPCTMDFTALATGQTGVHVVGTITAEEDMISPSLKLFVALMTDTMQYSSPPGSNGEVLFPDVFRDMWPDGSTGQTFNLSAGGTYDLSCDLVRAAAWDTEDLRVVVWIQDYTSRVVQQAGISHVSRNYGLQTESASARQLIWDMNGGEVSYQIDLTNIGILDDTYDVNLEGMFPDGWIHTVEAPGVPADPTHIQVPVAGGQQTQLTVRMNPNGHPGALDFDVHVTTPSEPLISSTENFRLMSGLDILLVDDDEGANRETWYLNAMEATGTQLVYGRWDQSVNSLDGSSLTGLDMVIWFTGDSWQNGYTLTAQDQLALSDYLDQGGRLFLSGQGIGFDCRTDPIFTDYIHAIYRQNWPGHFDIVEVPGDPIGNGLTLTIAGGDGANNQIRHSSSDPDASGYTTPVLAWGTQPQYGGYPALKTETNTFKLVYFGFGFEAISTAADRNTVMQRTMDWLLGTTGANEPGETVPREFTLGQNYPNPFNPETTIPYMLPEPARVTLHVFDVLGREVATLTPGLQDAGAHSMVFDGSKLSSGLYFYRLEAVGGAKTNSATRKLMLLK